MKTDAVKKYNETWGGDGHSIIKADSLVEMGFDEEFVGRWAVDHKSGTHYKEMIFDNKTGEKLTSLFGVYSLDFSYGIAREIGADTSGAVSKMGRGFQAQELYAAINEKLKEMEA